MQGPRLSGDCYLETVLGIFYTKNCSLELEYRLPLLGLSPTETIAYLNPRLYFCMLIAAFYAPHTNLPLPRILNQFNSIDWI